MKSRSRRLLLQLTLHNETFHLLAEGAFFWNDKRILGLSEVAIDESDSLERIHQLIEAKQPQEVLILGDLIRHQKAWSDPSLERLRNFFHKHQNLKWTLILGNHERDSKNYLEKLPVKIVNESLMREPFIFVRGHVKQGEHLFRIDGQSHPTIAVRQGNTTVRLRCWIKKKQALELPTFADVPRGTMARTQETDDVYAIAGEHVISVPFRFRAR